MHLHPNEVITDSELAAGKRALVWDAGWASVTGALSGGVVLVAFALSLGAGPMTVGLLAAIPLMAQAVQLPTIVLVERVRQRKRIGVLMLTLARSVIFTLALLPFLPDSVPRLPLLVAAQVVITVLSSAASCAVNAWFHQLLPAEGLGAFFARRLLVATGMACVGTLGAGYLVDNPPMGEPLLAYALAFCGAGLAGLTSSWYLAKAPEPQMHDAGPPVTLLAQIKGPLKDHNFRRVLMLLGGWNLASNLAAPFLTVYLMRQLGYGLGTVTTLWVTSQMANALTLYSWGRISDRLSNKAILAVAMPAYFACTLGLVFTQAGEHPGAQLALLYLVHVVMGAAGGGISLATGNLGLKLAPQGKGTAYLATIGLVSAVAGGMGPMLGGAIASWFEASELSVVMRWVLPGTAAEVSVLQFEHLEFIFALSALLGLYVLHALSLVQEGEEVSERRVMQELALEAFRSVNHLSSIGGVLGNVFTFERLTERRHFWRPRLRRATR